MNSLAMQKVCVLGVFIDNLTISKSLQYISFALNANKKTIVSFVNEDCLYKAQNDEEYRRVINSSDLVLPDGIGLRIIMKVFGHGMKDNCNGSDLAPQIIKRAEGGNYKIYLLGGREGVAMKAAHNLKTLYPNLCVVGYSNGYFVDDDNVIKDVNEVGTDILFVGMGVPKQEKWIARNKKKLNVKLCLGVGALLDYLSGRIPRAPLVFRRMHLEWAWRIFWEPRRMIKRYIIDGIKMFFMVFKQRFSRKKVIF